MSATLRVQDFRENQRLFPKDLYEYPPNFIKVEARQYPVTIHYNKVTKEDYVEQAYKKCVKIHRQLPQGGILVFLTGKKEILYLQRRLRIELKNEEKKKRQEKDKEESDGDGDEKGSHNEDSEEEETRNAVFDEMTSGANAGPKKVRILPLYSQLSPDKQYRVFAPDATDEDTRLIVLATNVAETSLTIPGIRYVLDCGRSKEKVYDDRLSMSSFKVQWISQASAEQRAGRAGRTGPGHCYRLYSAALFSKLADYSKPEILRTPLDQTMLQLKSLGVEDLARFPYVTQPPMNSIQASIKQLALLGAFKLSEASLR